jgi:hypothetical protein
MNDTIVTNREKRRDEIRKSRLLTAHRLPVAAAHSKMYCARGKELPRFESPAGSITMTSGVYPYEE